MTSTGKVPMQDVTADADACAEQAGGIRRPAGQRPELIGRGTAVGYTGAYRESAGVDIEEVVAVLLARGPR